jgi:hypothetical protein
MEKLCNSLIVNALTSDGYIHIELGYNGAV